MVVDEKPVTGGCFCGAVRYEARGAPIYVPYCHCSSCRKATGAPVALRICYEKDQVRFIEGKLKHFESSPGVHRGFCSACGTPTTWEGSWGGKARIEVYISTLDHPESFVPDRHAFCDDSLSWFDVADDLPRFPGTSPPGPLDQNPPDT